MAYAKSVWSFLFLVLTPDWWRVCAARRSAAPSPHQCALAEKLAVFGIEDFGRVNEYLYRGAQPKEEGIEELKKLGTDTIVRSARRTARLDGERTRAFWVAGNAAGEHSRDWLNGATG
jgi:hypothetical protein